MKGAINMESERINEPLLYIDQPIFQKPKAYMQENYLGVKTDDKEKVEEQNGIQVESLKSKREGHDSFKDLTIAEKIKYLIDIPSEVPKVRCEVLTNENRYRGVLIDENQENIVLRIFGRQNELVEKEKILSIKMIGF